MISEPHVKNRKLAMNVTDGIGFVPQGNRVFTELNVIENLEIGGYFLRNDKLQQRIEEVLCFFGQMIKDRNFQNAGKLNYGKDKRDQ